jgi:hypothetical protein
MEPEISIEAMEVDVPDTCPGCNCSWTDGSCPRCGLTQEDVVGLLQRGCTAYEHARAAALAGDFPLARLHLATVRSCGVATLVEHPAVKRLIELCAHPPLPGMLPIAERLPLETTKPDDKMPTWLLPLTVGGSAFGLAAWCVALLALLLSLIALVLALMALLRHV